MSSYELQVRRFPDNPKRQDQQVIRRAFIASAAAMAGLMEAPATLGSPTDRREDPSLYRLARMRGSSDQSLVIGFLIGRYAGVVDGQVTPLFGLAAATFSRYRFRDDGYDIVSFEQAYFTDLESGDVLDRFLNPYTGQDVVVPVSSLPPSRSRLLANLRFEATPNRPPGADVAHWIEAPQLIGDDVIHVEHLEAVVAAKPGQRPFRYNELTTLRSRVRDVDNPALTHAPCQTSFNAVVSWRPWLNMADRPGEMLGTGVGGYASALEALPKPWLKATARLRPELLTHPGASLDGLFT